MAKTKHQLLKGSTSSLFAAGKMMQIAKAAPEKRLQIMLLLKPDKSHKLESDRTVSRTKRKAQFAKRYSIADKVLRQLENFAVKYDLVIDKKISELGLVYLSGTVASLEKAFKVELHEHEYKSEIARYKQLVTGHQGNHKLPSSLNKYVSSVVGLSHVPLMHNAVAQKETAYFSAAKGMPTAWFAEYYQFPKRYSGRGQCIGIISCGGGINPEEVYSYCKKMGMRRKPDLEFISVNGEENAPGSSFSYDLEMSTDCLIAVTAAPGAKFKIYCTENSIKGFCDAIIKMTRERSDRPCIVSYSWGASESHYSPNEIKAVNRTLKYATTACDMTILCASGDKGSTNDYESTEDSPLEVQFPASSPWVTSCGGTCIELDDQGEPVHELAWNAKSNLYDILIQNASGGGFSSMNKMPDYQANALKQSGHEYPSGQRGVPDISAHADLSPDGIAYWISVDGQYWLSGGTSAVAPLLAGLFARINQALKKEVGFLNPLLYHMSETDCLRSIESGNNIMKNGPEYWYAGKGWDPCTGLGAPVGKNILRFLRQNLP